MSVQLITLLNIGNIQYWASSQSNKPLRFVIVVNFSSSISRVPATMTESRIFAETPVGLGDKQGALRRNLRNWVQKLNEHDDENSETSASKVFGVNDDVHYLSPILTVLFQQVILSIHQYQLHQTHLIVKVFYWNQI